MGDVVGGAHGGCGTNPQPDRASGRRARLKVQLAGEPRYMKFYPCDAPDVSTEQRRPSSSLPAKVARRIFRAYPRVQALLRVGAPRDVDLLHMIARIPLDRRPFVVTFEQHLPRPYGAATPNAVWSFARNLLLDRNCRKILPMSEYAKRFFLKSHADLPNISDLAEKLQTVRPGVAVKAAAPKVFSNGEPLRILFVGHDFARKGGVVAVRIAKKAKEIGLPVHVDLAGSLGYGSGVPTDHTDPNVYNADVELLKLDNVTHHGHIGVDHLNKLYMNSHFTILATIEDTYGFSSVESLAWATPVIASNISALPEIVQDRVNGITVEIELNQMGNWIRWGEYFSSYQESFKAPFVEKRGTAEYWEILDATFETMASQAIEKIAPLFDSRNDYEEMSLNALSSAKRDHSHENVSRVLSAIYREAVS